MAKPNPRTIIIILVAAAIVAGLIWWFAAGRESDEPLKLYGNVDIREVDLSFRVDGRIAELMVDEGDAVTAGQVLARLDPDPLTAELTEAEAAVRSQEAQVSLLQAGSRREAVARAAATRDERRIDLANAQADLDRLDTLRGTGAVSREQLENATSARNAAAARLRAAEQELLEQRNGNRPQEIEQARATLDQRRASADRVQLRLNDTVLRAPSAGTILTRAAETGAIVTSGTTIFTQALARPVWARIYVDALNLGLVAPGTIVNLTTDSAPEKIYQGRVGYVSPTAEFTPKSVETEELRTDLVYRARVVVLDPDSRLRQGMPITVQFPEATQSNAD